MKKITVLSGKGGVGKSSIAASLAILLSKKFKVVCADCDVDASNLALVLGLNEKEMDWEKISTNEKAFLIERKCIGCKKCVKECYFNAINWNEERRPEFDEFGCEGCGVCALICPEKAIFLKRVENAGIGIGKTKQGFLLVSGQLKMGESGSGKVVAEVKRIAEEKAGDAEIMVVDAAAGIGCHVIASVAGSDFVIAVTEPTPSGLSDLKRALEITKHFGIPSGIIINKHDLNQKMTKEIEGFAEKNGLIVMEKIPFDKSFSDALMNLRPVIEFKPGTKKYFERIAGKIPIE